MTSKIRFLLISSAVLACTFVFLFTTDQGKQILANDNIKKQVESVNYRVTVIKRTVYQLVGKESKSKIDDNKGVSTDEDMDN